MTRFYTLGPAGSYHHFALREYLSFQGVRDPDIVLTNDLIDAAALAATAGNAYVLQCSAHLNVHLVTERFRDQLPVVDTFILPTQPMALLKRRDVTTPRRLGLPEPTLGYINTADWDELIFETTKPVVAEKLLAGSYDAGIAYVRTASENPEQIEIMQHIGEVVTTWILYGPRPRYQGKIIATPYPELHEPLGKICTTPAAA